MAEVVPHEWDANGVCHACNRCNDPACCTAAPSCPQYWVGPWYAAPVSDSGEPTDG